jgi:hypothetical protein
MKQLVVLILTLFSSSGCVVVAGYDNQRGWYLWPGTIVIFLVAVLLFLLLRRRK